MTQRERNWLLVAPAAAWFLVMLVLPLSVVLVFSFVERGPAGGYVPALTLEQYANLPARLTAFKNTMILAPLLGLAVDAVMAHGPGGAFWPLGAAGAVAAVAFLVSSPRS